jgi:hypothetical protein
MAQERLDVAQVGSALVEKERSGRMPQRVRGNNRQPRALAGELDAYVNALLLNGAPSLPEETSADLAKLTPPPRRSRTPLTLSRKRTTPPSEPDNSVVRGRSRNEPSLIPGGGKDKTRHFQAAPAASKHCRQRFAASSKRSAPFVHLLRDLSHRRAQEFDG